ncbi:unnamed protein product [Ectocarpus sp. 12 AP-2014]
MTAMGRSRFCKIAMTFTATFLLVHQSGAHAAAHLHLRQLVSCDDTCEYTSTDGTTGRTCDPTCDEGEPYGVYGCNTKDGEYGSSCRYCFNDISRAIKFDSPDDRTIMCDTLQPADLDALESGCTDSCEYTSNDGTTGRMCDPTCENGDPYGVLLCDTKSGQYGSNCRYCFNDVDRAMKFDSPDNRAIMCDTRLPVGTDAGGDFDGNSTHLGCFMDSPDDRVLGHKLTDDDDTTAEFCYDYCVGLRALWMATQFGKECWCATEVDIDYTRHGQGAQCNQPCAGDEKESCGGFNAFDLYRIDSDYTTSAATPEGAFSEDIVQIIEVEGTDPGGAYWADSYSVGGKCYMQTTFDHGIGEVEVDTPQGTMKIEDLFNLLEPGPGSEGRPLYNDIQCGNGPVNSDSLGDEFLCPGLVEYGREGCGQIGPMWDLSELQ